MTVPVIPAKIGKNAKLYFCAAGIAATPTWTEVTNVQNLKSSDQMGGADVTTRGSGRMKLELPTLETVSVEFDMIWNTLDAALQAFKAAYQAGGYIGVAIMDGDITVNGSEGLVADMAVFAFEREEPLEAAMTAKVTLKPTLSPTAPFWKVVANP